MLQAMKLAPTYDGFTEVTIAISATVVALVVVAIAIIDIKIDAVLDRGDSS